MSIFTNPSKVFANVWEKISHIFHDDVEPVLLPFFEQFASDEGRLILEKGVAAADRLASGEAFGIVAASTVKDLVAQSVALAEKDVKELLLAVQSAMQIGKVAGGTLSATDQASLTEAE
jgi:hypothetical protein